jgi:hypothetical protein
MGPRDVRRAPDSGAGKRVPRVIGVLRIDHEVVPSGF